MFINKNKGEFNMRNVEKNIRKRTDYIKFFIKVCKDLNIRHYEKMFKITFTIRINMGKK